MKIIIIFYFLSYFTFFVVGFISGKLFDIKVSKVREILIKLYDPFTIKLKGLLHLDFEKDIKNKKRFKIFYTIFFNNLLFGCFVSRTLYGLVFFYPYILVIIGAFNQGIAISRIKMFNPLLFLEFVAYLLAASCGTNIGINLIKTIFIGNYSGLVISIHQMAYVYIVIIITLFIHTLFETVFLTKFEIPEGMTIDIKKGKEYLLNIVDHKK